MIVISNVQRKALEDAKRDKMCLSKRPFHSAEAAIKVKPEQRAYKCPYCEMFHLTKMR